MLLNFRAAKPAEEAQTAQEEQVAQIAQAVEERAIDEFDIQAGMRVDVLTLSNRLTFIGKVDSYRGGALVIRDARDYDRFIDEDGMIAGKYYLTKRADCPKENGAPVLFPIHRCFFPNSS